MKKRILSFAACLLIALILSACGGTSTTQEAETSDESELPEVTLNLANVVAVGTDEDTQAHMMADIVSERTDGKFIIEVYSGGTLGTSKDTIEGLKSGIADIVIDSFAYLDQYSEATWCGFETAGFVYRDYDQYKEYWAPGGGGEKLLERLEEESTFKVFGAAMDGSRHLTSKKPVYSPDDLAGMNIRVPSTEINIGLWEALGANATPMDFSEVYTALQQNMVDGQENPLSTSYNAAMYEVCPYLTITAHSILTDAMMMDRAKFESLPVEYQEILLDAAEEAAAWRTDNTIANEELLKQQFADQGVEIIEDIDRTPWAELADAFHKTLDQSIQDVIAEVKESW